MIGLVPLWITGVKVIYVEVTCKNQDYEQLYEIVKFNISFSLKSLDCIFISF